MTNREFQAQIIDARREAQAQMLVKITRRSIDRMDLLYAIDHPAEFDREVLPVALDRHIGPTDEGLAEIERELRVEVSQAGGDFDRAFLPAETIR